MLKRLLSAALAVCLILTVCLCASAADLESRATSAAPDDLQFVFTYPNEGSECIEAVVSVPDAMCTLCSENMQDPYLDRVTAIDAGLVQFDWSIDSRDAFHYDKSWDTAAGDSPLQQLSGGFAEKKEVFWFAYPQSVERCAGALKETEKDGATVRTFDFDAHKLYVRARFMVYIYATGECLFSDWSDIYDVGAFRDRKAQNIPDMGESHPVFRNAWLDDGVLHYAVQYPDSIQKTAQALLGSYGTTLAFESQMRVDGGEWQYWETEFGDTIPYLSGTRTVYIDDVADAGTIEYRCRLIGHDPSNGNAIITGWSDYATVKDGKAEVVENDDPFGEKAEAKRLKEAEREANKCKLCGICPFHPFGVCMFIWLGAILLIALTVVYIVVSSKKKKKRQAEIKAREEASRQSAPDKTGSFVQTDLVKLKTQEDIQAQEAPNEEAAQEEKTDES